MIKIGDVLKDRYVIERHLGKGGMGSVYLATDRTFGSQVALKETIVQGDGLEEAFEQEARVLNKLRHGAIPVVMDYFIEGDGRFLVMQYIPGDDLSTLIDRTRKPFPPDRVLEWADKLLDALTYLHTQDPPVIHRDIKPQNLKLTDRDEIVLLDFGLSKSAVGGAAAQSVSVFGYTPNYAPLEQVQGTGTDPRSDLFSLAATLYHLLAGIKPPDAVTRATSPADPIRPICEVAPGVSRQVSEVIMSALAIRREDRPPTAAEFRSALKGAAFEDLLSLAQGFDFGDTAPQQGEPPSGATPATERAPARAEAEAAVPSSELPTVISPGAPHVDVASAAPSGALPPVLPTVVGPGGGAAARPMGSGIDIPTVVMPGEIAPLAPLVPDPRGAAVPGELPTVVTPSPYPLPPPEAFITVPKPAPVVRNTRPPSTVSFVFETATLTPDGQIEKREKRVARHYFEDAGGGASISLVEIPKGEAIVGSPYDEPERQTSEGPPVHVTVPSLFVSRWPVTQAQWRSVARSLPKFARDLDEDPSHFKGDDRPVEMVSWEDAREFCDRLTTHTGRDYRLPSEQEWEYACRAGSATPFSFGSTLTAEVANVEAAISYGEAPSGDGRSETTPAGSLGLANRFGLFDMHGNVWEWTEDCWHDTFVGAPTDGSPWIDGGDPTVRVIRGGSWASIPADSRSATRFSFLEKGRRNDVGFRIVMAPVDSR
jgi:formylglycine-generating enzyme required for sulfatase activity